MDPFFNVFVIKLYYINVVSPLGDTFPYVGRQKIYFYYKIIQLKNSEMVLLNDKR